MRQGLEIGDEANISAGGDPSSGNYGSEATGWWWPIGSMETTTVNGKLFASDDPALGKDDVSRAGFDEKSKYNGWHGQTHPKGTSGAAIDIAGYPSNKYYAISIGNGTVTQTGSGISDGSNGHGGMGNHVIVQYGDITVRYMHFYDGTIKVKTRRYCRIWAGFR